MKFPVRLTLGLLLIGLTSAWAAGSRPHVPVSSRAEKHLRAVDSRGDMAMGFSHAAATHHFVLLGDGGAIRIVANDPKDTASRDAIRSHLRMIRGMFAAGNFELPMFIHATTPPGMETMTRLRKQITYAYEEIPRGAQVHLSSRNRRAVAAIHHFLQFQIREHQTGDPMTVQRSDEPHHGPR